MESENDSGDQTLNYKLPETVEDKGIDEFEEGVLSFNLIERQNILLEINLVEFFCESIVKDRSMEIQENLLILAIKLLEGGNKLG